MKSLCLILATATLAQAQVQLPDIPMVDTTPSTQQQAPPPPPRVPRNLRLSSSASKQADGDKNNQGAQDSMSPPEVDLSDIVAPLRSQRKSSTTQATESTQEKDNIGSNQRLKVNPQAPSNLKGEPVKDRALEVMTHNRFEAIFSSRSWMAHWNSADFGVMRVTSLPRVASVPAGAVIRWTRDSLGNPSVMLRARMAFPKLKPVSTPEDEEPIDTVHVVIAQHVSLYHRNEGWFAAGSPMFITLEEEGKDAIVLVPVSRGANTWRARLSEGGIYLENFIGAGLAVARMEIARHFRDEEIRMFLEGNSDVIFYLRPAGK